MLRVLVPEQNPAGAVYGLIIVGALLAAESYNSESYLDAVASVAITVVVYWLAHAYSGALGERVQSGEALTPRSIGRALTHSWSVVRGATVPGLTLLTAWIVGASLRGAISAAVWSTVGALIGLELLAGIRAKSEPLELVIDCCVGACIGAAVLLLRALLH